MNSARFRIVKVGGSLFSWDNVSTALQRWFELQPPMCNVLLAGGGEFAETVRSADARLGLGEAASHWICIDLLRATSRLLTSLVPSSRLLTQWADLKRLLKVAHFQEVLVFDPVEFLHKFEQSAPGDRLPETWDATTDSIAARVASSLAADELVLLKSVTARSAESLESLAERGIVDQFFPLAAKTLSQVRIVNLRATPFDEVNITASRRSMPQ